MLTTSTERWEKYFTFLQWVEKGKTRTRYDNFNCESDCITYTDLVGVRVNIFASKIQNFVTIFAVPLHTSSSGNYYCYCARTKKSCSKCQSVVLKRQHSQHNKRCTKTTRATLSFPPGAPVSEKRLSFANEYGVARSSSRKRCSRDGSSNNNYLGLPRCKNHVRRKGSVRNVSPMKNGSI